VEEDFYSVDEAARILKLTPGRIRQMLRAGELEGIAKRRLLLPGRRRKACSELAGA
jgi:excisionase family DNA binding protein